MHFSYLLQFNDIFEVSENDTKENCLRRLPKKYVLEACIYIANYSNLDKSPHEILNYLFHPTQDREFRNEVAASLSQFEARLRNEPTTAHWDWSILNKVSLLKLYEFTFYNKEDNDEDLVGNNNTQDLFKLILLFNRDENILDETLKTSVTGINPAYEKITAMVLAKGLAQFELTNRSSKHWLADVFLTQFKKALLLFNFIAKAEPNLIRLFLQKYQCDTVKDYINLYLPLVLPIISPNPNLDETFPVRIGVQNNDDNVRIVNFLNQFVSFDATLESLPDFATLRANPLYKDTDGSYLAVEPLFVAQRLYNSLYFEFRDIYLELKTPEEQIINPRPDDQIKRYLLGQFRRIYTSEFSENTLLYKTLDRIFHRNFTVKLPGTVIRDKLNYIGEPDFYVRNRNNIFLFENKDNLVSGVIKSSNNFSDIENTLQSLFFQDAGLKQIINNIKAIIDPAANPKHFDTGYNRRKLSIFPILVTARSDFEIPGFNNYLQKDFNRRLAELKVNGLEVSNVRPLTVINIDTLITFDSELRDDTAYLANRINSYHGQVNNIRKQFDLGIYEHTDELSFYTEPFSAYMKFNAVKEVSSRQLVKKKNSFMDLFKTL
ncbi:hypothetical protein [Dyadobacter sp. Leaf189]|uniref:hypothetical protein n=1 Tax=Dyadobacter sp. Leaf189 TaxID=1736295 RepID=UPI0006FD7E6C|nr:hypothetical protein [Dyadobacter sp. Leaf189]KQS32743.1 hypothetical protein ASG33_01110 [Dyadobacter sp. Leaf189]